MHVAPTLNEQGSPISKSETAPATKGAKPATLVSVSKAATLFGKSRTAIQKLIKEGKITKDGEKVNTAVIEKVTGWEIKAEAEFVDELKTQENNEAAKIR